MNPHVDVRSVIARELALRGMNAPTASSVAVGIMEALKQNGIHFVSVPQFRTDPPEGSPEYEALADPLALTYGMPDMRLELGATVDGEWLHVRNSVSYVTIRYYMQDPSLRTIMRRKMGYELLRSMWERFDPEGVVPL